jgi:MYXO-CTERM domain-containing protein
MSSPAFPICEADVQDDPSTPRIIGDGFAVGIGCEVRVLANPPVEGGLRYEHWRDEVLLDEATVTTSTTITVPSTRHECDGSVTMGDVELGVEYGHLFPDAAVGDTVIVFAGEEQIGSVSFALITCPAIGYEPQECQVCGPEGGCTVGGDAGLGVLVAAAIALVCRRRAR